MQHDHMNIDSILKWEKGYGAINHSEETKAHVNEMIKYFIKHAIIGDDKHHYNLLIAADHLTNAAMWLAVHQVYANHVNLKEKDLSLEDFKQSPQGHLGGTLNMIPAYVGYLLANALMGVTRGWVMEQGHAVAAIDCVNLLVSNMSVAHSERYNISDAGLTRFVNDFYSYKLNSEGYQDSPLGSHVNPHTGGGHMEGGYLGFAGLQYVHMPLKDERLVAFLSDGAFEEQRGPDWAPRWWRAEDSGLVCPIMIANGRRIDQRTTIEQEGGVEWLKKHLTLNGFDPIVIDGRDPAAFAWLIFEQERRLQNSVGNMDSIQNYNIKIPYGIAVAPKGAGFYNEGTNYAHNLPLVDNPSVSEVAAKKFNKHVKKLFVPQGDLLNASKKFQQHNSIGRTLEKDNPIANRNITLTNIPETKFKPVNVSASPMEAIDEGFLSIVKANPHLRPRVGNPDELLSNHMEKTLGELKFRVVEAEAGSKEFTLGNVITALNEEAVAASAFGNKGGINMIVTYEAFGAKIFGGARQEVTFSKHKKNIGSPAKWLSIPIVLTSNTWENSKNELSHQDPSMAESMLSETSDISRVIFPADFNSAARTIEQLYQTQGQIWTIIVPKGKLNIILDAQNALQLAKDGAIRLKWLEYNHSDADIALVAIGAYQLAEVLKASIRLKDKNIAHTISYITEPGKFREPRNSGEAEYISGKEIISEIIKDHIKHVLIVSHTRPEVMLGTLQPLWNGRNVKGLGFINEGGTLGVDDMFFVNKCSWAHIIHHVENITKFQILTNGEIDALNGNASPDGVITKLL